MRSAQADGISLPLLVAVGSLASLVLSWPRVLDIWHTGTFADTDDAMRMVEVRSWLGGQGWFDLTVPRLDPPHGLLMHWSRVVDVPLGVMIRLFGLVVSAIHAELLARLVFPLTLQIALVSATLRAAVALAGRRAALPAMILIVTNGFQFGQFVPGRIDHHAPQIVLLMLATGSAVRLVIEAHQRSAVAAGLAIALSMAISLENLPFFALLIAALAIYWVWRGEALSAALRTFGLSLAGCAILLFLLTVPPWRYGAITADSYSVPHATAATLGGLVLVGLTILPRLTTPMRRIGAIMIGGGAVLGLVLLLFPAILAGPYAALDPVVRATWLSRVTEALPLPTVLRLHPQALTLIVCPLVAGLAAAIVAAVREPGPRRFAWVTLAVLIGAGLALSCWEVRVISSVSPLAILGGAWIVTLVQARAGRAAALGSVAMLLPFSALAWATVPTPAEKLSVSKATADAENCRAARNVTPLASLGDGLVLAPIDSGSHLLVHTGLSVLGAPYHRNNHGNRFVIDSFSAAPDAAGASLRAAGVRYVALCPGQVQAEALVSDHPDGLAAALLAGRVPAWLRPVPLEGTTYRVFAVR